MHKPWKRGRLMLAIAAALSLTLAGCGDGGDGDEADETSDTSAAAEAAAEVEVTLVDYAFQGLPPELEAGTKLTVTNGSQTELHELVAFRLPESETRPITELAQLPQDQLEPALGGAPVTVLLAAPGAPMIPAVGDGTLADPGRYAVMCFIPTGANPEEYLQAAAESQEGPPQVEGGPPHFTKGMLAEVTVA